MCFINTGVTELQKPRGGVCRINMQLLSSNVKFSLKINNYKNAKLPRRVFSTCVASGWRDMYEVDEDRTRKKTKPRQHHKHASAVSGCWGQKTGSTCASISPAISQTHENMAAEGSSSPHMAGSRGNKGRLTSRLPIFRQDAGREHEDLESLSKACIGAADSGQPDALSAPDQVLDAIPFFCSNFL